MDGPLHRKHTTLQQGCVSEAIIQAVFASSRLKVTASTSALFLHIHNPELLNFANHHRYWTASPARLGPRLRAADHSGQSPRMSRGCLSSYTHRSPCTSDVIQVVLARFVDPDFNIASNLWCGIASKVHASTAGTVPIKTLHGMRNRGLRNIRCFCQNVIRCSS